jgi:hypothetical protein
MTKLAQMSDLIDAKANNKQLMDGLNSDLKILKEEQDHIDFLLMQRMDADGLSLTKNDRAKVFITETTVAKVEDWDAFYEHILSNKAFELLERRPANKAYRDLLEIGEDVPGLSSNTLRRVNFRTN